MGEGAELQAEILSGSFAEYADAYRVAHAEFNAAVTLYGERALRAFDRAVDPFTEVYAHLENAWYLLCSSDESRFVGEFPSEIRKLAPSELEKFFLDFEKKVFSSAEAEKLPPVQQLSLFERVA